MEIKYKTWVHRHRGNYSVQVSVEDIQKFELEFGAAGRISRQQIHVTLTDQESPVAEDAVSREAVINLIRSHCTDWIKEWKTSLGDPAGPVIRWPTVPPHWIDFNKAKAAIKDLPTRARSEGRSEEEIGKAIAWFLNRDEGALWGASACIGLIDWLRGEDNGWDVNFDQPPACTDKGSALPGANKSRPEVREKGEGDEPCSKCGGTVGHRINCPDGIAFTNKEAK
jgi:hypothetical protein